MTLDKLTENVLKWTNNKTPGSSLKLVADLAEYLYKNLDRYRLEWINEDRRSDFFLWLYPKFASLLDKFDPSRASFNTYLYWNVRMSWKSFIRASFSAEARERVLELEEGSRLLCLESESRFDKDWGGSTLDCGDTYELGGKPSVGSRLSPKRKALRARLILLLACKSSAFLADQDIARVAAETDTDEQWLRSKIEELNRSCSGKTETLKKTRERINVLYFRIRRCRYEQKYLDPESSRYRELTRESETCTRRLESVRRTEARHFRAPSNRLLARTLGIPRGTIDSVLASARPGCYAE